MKITPINLAEAIIEPFWDEEINEFPAWEIAPGTEYGLRVHQWWCSVNFDWFSRPPEGVGLSMRRDCGDSGIGLKLEGYDTLLLSLMAPEGSRVRLSAETELGRFETLSEPFGSYKRELSLPMGESGSLYRLQIDVLYNAEGAASGWLNWVGLASSKRLPLYLSQFTRYDSTWEGELYPEGIPLSYQPAKGIFFSAEDLEGMRKTYRQAIEKGASSPFVPAKYAENAENAEEYELFRQPEACIGDFVNFWDDTRYCRERDSGHWLLRYGVRAAMEGILTKDAGLLRLAARYAVSLLQCGHWDDGMICVFPEGAWEHRCFVQSLCLYDLVFIYDLTSEYFTPAARHRLFRRIAEEGLSSINYITWKHEYIFQMNQLIWFSHGRMAGYALLQTEWPRVREYLEIAYREAVENLQNTVLPDGGYVEGPTYFTCVGYNGGQALHLYSRAVGKELSSVVPANLANSAGFAEALASTDSDVDMIPICDARPVLPHAHLGFMASFLPESRWVDIYHKAVARAGGLPDDYYALLAQSKLPPPTGRFKSFLKLADMRIAASQRQWEGGAVKLLVLGNRAGAGHTHEDKGSFVLEYAGQTFAMDPGTCDYSSPYSLLYKHCQRHNMLVPAGSPERAAPESPCMADITPEGAGDEQRLTLSLEAGLAFPKHYRRWRRSFDSPAPNRLTILDDYVLAPDCGCDRVEFLWNTMLPAQVSGGVVQITGREGSVSFAVPEGCACRIETVPGFENSLHHRIVLTKLGLEGTIRVQVTLRRRNKETGEPL